MPRNRISVVKAIAQYGLPPGESMNRVHSPFGGTLSTRSVSSASLFVRSPTSAISMGPSYSSRLCCSMRSISIFIPLVLSTILLLEVTCYDRVVTINQHHKDCLFCGVGKEKYCEVLLNRGCQVPSVSEVGVYRSYPCSCLTGKMSKIVLISRSESLQEARGRIPLPVSPGIHYSYTININ